MKTRWYASLAALALIPMSLAPAQAVASPEAAARAQASAALAGVLLPAGANRLAHQPSADIGAVPTPNPYPTSVVVARWYTVPGTIKATITRIKAHPPAGWLLEEDTETGSPQQLVFDDGPSSLVVTAAQVGDHVDVGEVADVLWLPLRTVAETVPATAAVATISYTGPVPAAYQGSTVKRAHQHLVVRGATAQALGKALNQAPVSLPYKGTPYCYLDFGEQIVATFSYGGHQVTFTVAPAGCPHISVRADGVQQPALDPHAGVFRELTRLLHRTIPWTQR